MMTDSSTEQFSVFRRDSIKNKFSVDNKTGSGCYFQLQIIHVVRLEKRNRK